MARRSTLSCVYLSILLGCSAFGDDPAKPAKEEKQTIATMDVALRDADNLWRDGKPDKASWLYNSLLNGLPKTCEPFRATFIMRLARAQFASGKKDDCSKTLKLLDAMDYVPEHHALAAKELAVMLKTGKNPGLARTPVPRLPKSVTSIQVSPTGPVRTLSTAIAAARKGLASGKTVEIVLAPGTYMQTETVVLTDHDSGLVIRSRDPKDPAVLTGGVNLATWKKASDPAALAQLPEAVRKEVLVCDLKEHGIQSLGELVFGGFSSRRAVGGNHRFKSLPVPELFYQRKPQTLARWPNDKLTKLPVNAAPGKPDPRFARWAKETDLWLYGYWHWDWADAYEKVAGIDEAGKITLVPPTNRYGFRRKLGCAVNALCELDQPGEWHLDTKSNRIHYLPPKDFDPAECTLSSYGTIIAAEKCENLQLRNLKIEFVRGDALTFIDCPNLLLAGLDIEHCSGIGLGVRGGKEHLIHSCRINSMGRGGIDFSAGDWQKLIPCNSIIENCSISDLSRIDRTYTPALLLEGMGIKVRNNSFTNIPSSAIRLEACDARIEMNYFHRCVYESGDQGSIDMWANPLYRGNIIRWNDFDRIISNGGHYGAAGVRHDDYISGFMVSENIFRKGSKHGFGAVQFNQGTDNYVEGNIIIDWHKAFTGRTTYGKAWKQKITGHSNSKRVLAETDWQSEAWQKKYPKVRDLFNGDDNHNYLVDNQRFGTGTWGGVGRAINFINRTGDPTFHGETLKSVKDVLVPWHPIPIDRIGPYRD